MAAILSIYTWFGCAVFLSHTVVLCVFCELCNHILLCCFMWLAKVSKTIKMDNDNFDRIQTITKPYRVNNCWDILYQDWLWHTLVKFKKILFYFHSLTGTSWNTSLHIELRAKVPSTCMIRNSIPRSQLMWVVIINPYPSLMPFSYTSTENRELSRLQLFRRCCPWLHSWHHESCLSFRSSNMHCMFYPVLWS